MRTGSRALDSDVSTFLTSSRNPGDDDADREEKLRLRLKSCGLDLDQARAAAADRRKNRGVAAPSPRLWAADGFLDSTSDKKFMVETPATARARGSTKEVVPEPPKTARPATTQPGGRRAKMVFSGNPAKPPAASSGGLSATVPNTPRPTLGGTSALHNTMPAITARLSTKQLLLKGIEAAQKSGDRPQTTPGLTKKQGFKMDLKDSIKEAAEASRPPPGIYTYAPKWWIPDEKEKKAIADFDKRHRQHVMRANRIRENLRIDPTSLSREHALEVSIWELGAARFYMDEEIAGIRTYAQRKGKKKKKKPWKLMESIWVPRIKTSPGKDFWDTQETKDKAFSADWDLACERMSLGKKIQRAADKLEPKDETPIETFKECMMQYTDLLFQTFTFYASQGAGHDLFSLSKNSFLQLIRDLDLVDNSVMGQRDQDLQLIFESANASAKKEDEFNQRVSARRRVGSEVGGWGVRCPLTTRARNCTHVRRLSVRDAHPPGLLRFSTASQHSLNRAEYMSVMVQFMLLKYLTGQKLPIEDGIKRFFEDLVARVPRECLHDPNAFRTNFCYIEETDLALRAYESSLKVLYHAFAFGTGAVGDAILTVKLLDLMEYLQLITHLDLVDPFTTMREVRLNFLFSRMMVIDENITKGRQKIVQLNFEDFLELVVRFAYIMAMPTDQDLFDLGVTHAGEYLQWLDSNPEAEFVFKQERARDMDEKLETPIGQKVKHFIEWMLYSVRGGAPCKEGTAQSITKKEAEKFQRGLVPKIKTEAAEGQRGASAGGGEGNAEPMDDDDLLAALMGGEPDPPAPPTAATAGPPAAAADGPSAEVDAGGGEEAPPADAPEPAAEPSDD